MAEARACFKKELGFRDVCVEGDALTARFVPRGANAAAHGLAMEGRKYTWPMYWIEEVSRAVEWLVDKDQSGSRANDRAVLLANVWVTPQERNLLPIYRLIQLFIQSIL
ncbi:hypothetical protein Gorai_019074, partial [Gossypium raimondii]|nr:hypothetical protein [Gossypium raimondii]